MAEVSEAVELLEDWAKALRSGSYRPGGRFLRSIGPDGTIMYSAYGVLCDIFDPERWDKVHCSYSEIGRTGCWGEYPPPDIIDAIEICDAPYIRKQLDRWIDSIHKSTIDVFGLGVAFTAKTQEDFNAIAAIIEQLIDKKVNGNG